MLIHHVYPNTFGGTDLRAQLTVDLPDAEPAAAAHAGGIVPQNENDTQWYNPYELLDSMARPFLHAAPSYTRTGPCGGLSLALGPPVATTGGADRTGPSGGLSPDALPKPKAPTAPPVGFPSTTGPSAAVLGQL